MKRFVIFFGVFCNGAQVVSADPVTDVCLAYNDASVCECATEALKAEIGYKDFAYYLTASATALKQQSEGTSLVDAWDMATKNHAAAAGVGATEALNQINAYGSEHRDAIKNCTN